MKKLVLASNNAKKMKELSTLLAPLGFEVIPQGQLGIAEAEEPHCTFVENALAKARHASKASGLPALADDSGLCVAALAVRRASIPPAMPANRNQMLATTRSCSPIWAIPVIVMHTLYRSCPCPPCRRSAADDRRRRMAR
jgi:hypothetical protein